MGSWDEGYCVEGEQEIVERGIALGGAILQSCGQIDLASAIWLCSEFGDVQLRRRSLWY